MGSDPISQREAGASPVSATVIARYLLLACLFTVAVVFQYGAARAILNRSPIKLPLFAPSMAGNTIDFVDSRAAAAGLHRGDIIVAINGQPYTGTMVYWHERQKASPGGTLVLTVRSPAANSPPRTIRFPIEHNNHWVRGKTFLVPVAILMPAFCIALGFWVVLVRPSDPSAWILLGLMLTFAAILNETPAVETWGPGMLKLAMGYGTLMALAWPIFMFLFGFFFPEPFPFFQRAGKWRKALLWIVLVPYVIVGVLQLIVMIGGLDNYASVEPLYHAIRPFLGLHRVYSYFLVGGFFGFIFAKSSMAISPDAKRRLRLLYWGTTLALSPLLIFAVFVEITGASDYPDWLLSFVVSMLLVFPLTMAYVIVVQRAMDIRVVVRQGLQYAVAKNGVRTLQFLAILLVTLTGLALIGQSRARPQKIIVIGIGLLAIFTIRRLTEMVGAWIDRRFFREAYDAEQVLGELSDSVRSMVEVHSMIETVAGRISATLHIPHVAVLLGKGGAYRPAYALGYNAPPDIAFPANAGTVIVLRRQKEPARVYFDDPHSWLYREPEVTDADRSSLTRLDTELLLPLSSRNDLLGFISLGPKLSDEPYSRTDLRLLKSVATQTGLALENARLISAIADEVAQRERLNSEVQIARDVQERLFPQKLLPVSGIAYAGACRPALGVGGDYYDFLALPDGKLGIAIGDVSGKGIAAALTMASLQASLRSEATRAPDNLAAMMCNVNRLLHEALASNRYATFFYGQYDPASRQLTYVNAGHNPPMLFHANGDDWQLLRLEACGTVVGLLENASYQQSSLNIAPGDLLVAFTDGISEAMNGSDEEWGEEKLVESVKSCAHQAPSEIIARIMRDADAFAAGAKQNDDMTLVILCSQADCGGGRDGL